MTAATDRWAAQAGPRKVLAAVRKLWEEQRTGTGVTVRVDLNEPERAQVGRFLGLDWEASGQPITIGKLRAALARADDDLLDLLTRTGGPIDDIRARRENAAALAAVTIGSAYTTLAEAGLPAHAVELARTRRWLERPGSDRVSSKAADLTRLWQALPGNGRPLAEVANSLFADPHRLDRDTELGRIAARLLAAASAGITEAAAAADSALSAAQWRKVWAAYGISCDEVSATVLVLNLPLSGPAPAARIATEAAKCGEPVWLTARSLRGEWAPGQNVCVVRVCENPAVVEAAAERLGQTCLPLICIYGRPSSAAWTLLRGLASDGVRLLVTADRDEAGARFLMEMLALPGASEWLTDVEGLYEEARLDALINDLAQREASPTHAGS